MNSQFVYNSRFVYTVHNFCLKLLHGTCLELELYFVNQARAIKYTTHLRVVSRLHYDSFRQNLCKSAWESNW